MMYKQALIFAFAYLLYSAEFVLQAKYFGLILEAQTGVGAAKPCLSSWD